MSIKSKWKRSFEQRLARVSQPEYQKHYLKEIAPKLEKWFGAIGRWWNKWHNPRNIGGTICPVCIIRNGALNGVMPSFLCEEMELVAKSKWGKRIERFCDRLVVKLLDRYFHRIREKEQKS